MRNKETLIREFQLMAKCSEETVEAWWKSLNPKERTVVAEYYKEMLEAMGLVSPPLLAWAISGLRSRIARLEPKMQEFFKEVIDMLASLEEGDNESTD